MLSLARAGVRSRLGAFAGAATVLTLAVAVFATLALVIAAADGDGPHRRPQRFAAAPVVVRADPSLHVRDRYGTDDAVPFPEQPALPRSVVERFPSAIADRTFPVRVGGMAGDVVGHPWSSAAFAPYRLAAGRPPAERGEIVVGGGASDLVGRAVGVSTRDRTGTYTVSGVTTAADFERAVFFTDDEAARLSPPVDALVMAAVPEAGKVAGLDVLTGNARHRADPGYARDMADLTGLQAFLGVAALLAGSVSLFVVGSTFRLSVIQRRRELALLRLSGATPAQVVRMVCAEAVLVGAVGSAAGCAVALIGGPGLAAAMAARGLAPSWFRVSLSAATPVALAVAFAAGLAVPVAASLAAAVRAARTRPAEALREAATATKPTTRIRRMLGLAVLVCAVAAIAVVAVRFPQAASDVKTDVTTTLMLAAAAVALLPSALPPLVRLATQPFGRGPALAATLIRARVLADPHRSAAVVAPWLITMALAAALLGTADTARAAESRGRHEQASAADFVVAPANGHGLAADAMATLSGSAVTAVTDTTVLAYQPAITPLHFEAPMPVPFPAVGIDRPDAMRLPVSAGSLDDLDDTTAAVDTSWRKHVGDSLDLWLADGTRKSLRVVAVLDARPGVAPLVLSTANAGRAMPSRAYVRPGAEIPPDVLRRTLHDAGADLLPVSEWNAAVTDRQADQTRTGLVFLLALSLGFSTVGTVNSFAMLVTGRRRELELLRLSGALRRQILGVAAGEALTLSIAGTVLAAVAAALQLGGVSLAFSDGTAAATVTAPWLLLAAIAVTGSLVTVGAAAAVAALATRPRRTAPPTAAAMP